MLVMEHELFRHIETEMLLRCSQLAEAMAFLRETLQFCGGEIGDLSLNTKQRLTGLGLLDDALALAGTYIHHYPICIRKVLPDDALLSMSAGGDEPYYAISLISYVWPTDRCGFFAVAKFLVRSMAKLFDGRPHWGKHCPLDQELVGELYPNIDQFVEVCRQFDPEGVFRNQWANELLFQGGLTGTNDAPIPPVNRIEAMSRCPSAAPGKRRTIRGLGRASRYRSVVDFQRWDCSRRQGWIRNPTRWRHVRLRLAPATTDGR